MIAPTVESIEADSQIQEMGKHSLAVWPQWLAELPVPVFYRDHGSLLLWHRQDAQEAFRVERVLGAQYPHANVKRVESPQLDELEPALASRFSDALCIRNEAQVDNRELLKAVAIALEEKSAECHWNTFVEDGEFPEAGVVVDCRGMGARCNWPRLRGVRGEIVRLHAPEVELHHMLRLLHPRFPVYIVPRGEGRLVVGATSIESEDRSTVSVRGALELLTSAYSVLPALAEARILEFNTQVRPALPDNLPALHYDRGQNVLRINGLYRHGFLLTPVVVEEALSLLSVQGQINLPGRWPCLRQSSPDIHHIPAHEEMSVCLS